MSRTIGEFGMMSIPCSASDRHVADAHDQFLGVERLAGVVGRAGLLAAAALGAGEAVEQVLPAEVLEGLEPERRVLVLEVELRQLAARRQLAEVDVREGRRDVEVLAERQVAQERRDQRDVAPPQDREDRLEDVWREVAERDGQRVRDEGAGDVAVGRDLEDLGEQLGGDDAADHAEDDQRVPVEGQARRLEHEPAVRRPSAIETRTITATMFCIALMSVQRIPSAGILRTVWMIPPVTMLAVPIVSSTKPQKIPACITGCAGILEHLGLDEGVLGKTDEARRDVRERPRRPGDREDPQVAGHDEDEERRRSPEDEEDERVARDVLERREHQRSEPPSSVCSGVIA